MNEQLIHDCWAVGAQAPGLVEDEHETPRDDGDRPDSGVIPNSRRAHGMVAVVSILVQSAVNPVYRPEWGRKIYSRCSERPIAQSR